MSNSWYEKQLQHSNVRLTEGRKLVLDIFMQNKHRHLTSEDIFFEACKINPSIGISTIYRTIDLFVTHRLVQKFEFGEGKARFELKPDPDNAGHHHHMYCKICNKIIDYTDFMEAERTFLQTVEEGLSKRYNFTIVDHFIQFYGYCKNCAQ